MTRRLALCVVVAACSAPPAQLAPVGSSHDEGHGELAQLSRELRTAPEDPADGRQETSDEALALRQRDGSYGGSPYGNFVVRAWPVQPPPRTPRYAAQDNLVAAVEGTVTWRGAVPPAPRTSCGELPKPLRVGADRGLGGVLVYIEHTPVGRALPMDAKPTTVGGVVAKSGCAFLPAAQFVTPLPAPVSVEGDGVAVRVRVDAPAPLGPFALEAGGRVAFQAQPGVTRIDALDGAHAAAYLVATTSPAYAVTDDRGRFRLDELAAGDHELTFWHPPVPSVVGGVLVYGPPIVHRRSVRVARTGTTRADVVLGR